MIVYGNGISLINDYAALTIKGCKFNRNNVLTIHCLRRIVKTLFFSFQADLYNQLQGRSRTCVHLAIVHPTILRADLHQVFAKAKDSSYLVFIIGHSRTADIELNVTLGVHGPKNLYMWMMDK